MRLQKNKFKEGIVGRKTTYGIWNGLVDTVVAELLAGAGFDWIVIDGEHAPFDIRTIQQQMQAIDSYGIPIIVRPPVGEVNLIKQLTDIGVQSLLVPMVETAAQAELLVKAMRYPPEGIRGVGTALARASQWNRVDNYFEDANNEMCLICQIESVKGIENLEEILKVDGVDGVFIGPADLGASMGYLGKPNHPKVREAITKAIQLISKYEKASGVLSASKDAIAFYQSQDVNMVGVGIDTLLLSKATKDLAAYYKPKLKNSKSNTVY